MASREAKVPPKEKPNPRNNPAMFKIFDSVQHNVLQHKKYVKEMTKLYKKLDPSHFRESFKNALLYVFTFGDTSSNVDRVLQFVATFCTSLDDEEEFLNYIFEIIFECQCVSGQSVRYRASQLLATVLAALGDEASLDDDLCDKLLTSQLQRLQDTRSAVRCRAALALQRLQNPADPDDDVTRAYYFHMSCDPSSSVRRAIVMSIAKCTRNLPFVVQRLCDVDESVRRAAFLHVAAVDVKVLRVKQRLTTLKVGLNERSPRVRRVVEEILIPGWLSSYEGDIVLLLKAIRLDNASDAKDSQLVAAKLLESLFKRLPVSELLEWLPTEPKLRLVPAERLSKEAAWYWRHLAHHLHRHHPHHLDPLLPDLVVLVQYIRAILEAAGPARAEDPVSFGTRQYVLHELVQLTRVYDVSDPAGRAALHHLLTDALTGDYGELEEEVLEALVSALEAVLPNVTLRLEAVAAVLDALREPPADPEPPAPPRPALDPDQLKLKRARLRVSLNVATEAQLEAVRDQDYALADHCKAKVADIQQKLNELDEAAAPPPPVTIKEKKRDAATLNKCLVILNAALNTAQLKTLTPLLRSIFSDLEEEIYGNPEVRVNALKTVALYGMLDRDFVQQPEQKAFFFSNLVELEEEEVVCTVLRCVLDLLCVHGALLFSAHHDSTARESTARDDTSHASGEAAAHTHVIELLLKLMDQPCESYRRVIVGGLCRLLYLGHLRSPALLSRLLLLWFSPATSEEDLLRQTIGVFFQVFPLNVDNAQEQIQEAALPTLRALANAPASSPIAEVDQEAVVKFLVSLTRLQPEGEDSPGALGARLCAALGGARGEGRTGETALVCRALALLPPPRDRRLALQLAALLRDRAPEVSDKQSQRYLAKYLGALEALERDHKLSATTEAEFSTASDTMPTFGRATSSLPQPLARSTHVVIDETVEEEVEIDDSSPTDRNTEEASEEEARSSRYPGTFTSMCDGEQQTTRAKGKGKRKNK